MNNFVKNRTYQILTPNGYKVFDGIDSRKKNEYLIVELSNGKTIECSLNHIFISNGNEKKAKDLDFFDEIDTISNETVVVNNIEYKKEKITLYDVINVKENNLFIVDDIISHNCDVSFISSGETVIEPELLQFYKKTFVQDPLEKTGFDGNLWKWEYPNYSRGYMVVADVARGDAIDYSACHVIDLESAVQVAEYRGKLDTKSYGNFLVSLATDYNNAILVIERENVGWAVIQQVIDRGYPNLFYMSNDLKYVDVEQQMTNKIYSEEKKLKPGFSTNTKTRPLCVSKLDDYIREKTITIRSSRLVDELFTFIWKNGKAEAMKGYNDDLVMSMAIGLWVRDTALRLRQEGIDLTKRSLDGIHQEITPVGFGSGVKIEDNPWEMDLGDGQKEDLSQWL